MTEREEVTELDQLFIDVGLVRINKKTKEQAWLYNTHPLRNKILSWHQKHRVKVSRKQVIALFKKYDPGMTSISTFWKTDQNQLPKFIDDLLALLNGEVEWCFHIQKHKYQDNLWQYIVDGEYVCEPTNWTVCPICKEPRPERDE